MYTYVPTSLLNLVSGPETLSSGPAIFCREVTVRSCYCRHAATKPENPRQEEGLIAVELNHVKKQFGAGHVHDQELVHT